MYTIKLSDNNNFTGMYLGIPFVNGASKTDNDFIADKARMKGFEVTEEQQEKLFICSVCGKEYKAQEGLDKHIAEKHPGGEGNE